jgi:hypothetical protein
VLANAAHPGLVATNIYHRDGPRRPAGLVWAVAIGLLAQDAEHGALPVLYAAVAGIPGNSFAGPGHFAHMRGAPQLIGRSDAAQDPDLATSGPRPGNSPASAPRSSPSVSGPDTMTGSPAGGRQRALWSALERDRRRERMGGGIAIAAREGSARAMCGSRVTCLAAQGVAPG